MDSRRSKTRQAAGGLLALTLLVLCPAPALAHILYVYPERIEGATIHGYAYFPGEIPAQRVDVIVSDPSGRELGRTTTDDKGKFTFTARQHVDHCLLVKTPDGHSARHVVQASLLPDSLPAGGDQLAELSIQFKLLRDEVRKSEERLRFRDLLGGIGFILGLAGVALYMKARGKKY